jgi:hypothetical protein
MFDKMNIILAFLYLIFVIWVLIEIKLDVSVQPFFKLFHSWIVNGCKSHKVLMCKVRFSVCTQTSV